jgi:hypothetical protein
MAVMSNNDRATVWAEFMRLGSQTGNVGCLKADLRAAVDALDQFLSDNAAAINTAIPQPARGALTTPQKALLLQLVISKRYLSGT